MMLAISKILTAALFATLAMTLFSYVTSRVLHHNFREPQLLNLLLDKLPSERFSLVKEHIIGWIIHFSIGGLFVFIFVQLRKFFNIDLSLETGIIYGTLAGILGAIAWRIFFALHPFPPQIKKWQFLFHLIFAHIVFGMVMIWCLKMLNS